MSSQFAPTAAALNLAGPYRGVFVGVAGAAALALAAEVIFAAWPRRQTLDEWLDSRAESRMSSAEAQPRHLLNRPVRVVVRAIEPLVPAQSARWLAVRLRSAAREDLPQELLASWLLVFALASCLLTGPALLGLIPVSMIVPIAMAPVLLDLSRLLRAGANRRAAIVAQIPILVDLMSLEQSGGGVSSRRAMELVVSRVRGEAAGVLRTCLAGSATAGTPPLDAQLEQAAQELGVPALAALAAVVRLQRQEGISTAAPLGRLARGLRDRQRDDLTTRGRRALVTMLFPVAICILLPFVIIVLYPALERLSGALA
jgi:Flp pilus assembly protein TadB